MIHFGTICPTATGCLNPMTALGHELKKRGHRVTHLGPIQARSKVEAAGLDFLPLGVEDVSSEAIAASFDKLSKLTGIAAARYTTIFAKSEDKVLLQNAPAAIKKAKIEALLADQYSISAGTIAEFLGIPLINVCSGALANREAGVPPFIFPWQYNSAWWAHLRNQVGHQIQDDILKPILEQIADYRQQWNLPQYKALEQHYSELAQIGQQPAEFEFPRQKLPQCFHFTGPLYNPASREPIPFPWEKLTGQPLIYASMGTILGNMLGVFQKIASACEGLDAQLVISFGGAVESEALPQLPGNPLVVSYAPQWELLSKAALTITHAGMNTTLESLSNGVPMVAIPIMNDEPGVAARIAWTGCGEVVPLKHLSVPRLRDTVCRVLAEDSYKQNALRLQDAIRRAGGVTRAVDIIEQAASTGQPVINHSLTAN